MEGDGPRLQALGHAAAYAGADQQGYPPVSRRGLQRPLRALEYLEGTMLDVARDIIGSQPILTAFLAIGVGYLVGQINIFGFSLGVGAVLFVGLAIGAFAPKAQIIGPIGLTGLIMFLYGIGILYGKQFFEGMVGAGQKYNLLALIACLVGLAVALGLGQMFNIKIGHTLGLYAGSMTSTATLQAALDVTKSKDPSIGYSIAYPFGVIGPILCIYFMTRIVKPKFPAKAQRFHMGEISVGTSFAGHTLGDLNKKVLGDVQVTMVRKSGQNIVPTEGTILSAGDAVLVVADSQEALSGAAAKLGELAPGRLASDRADLDYIRVFVGKAGVVGIPLGSLPMPSGFPAHLLHVRRYDADLVPSPDLMLEFGDRVGVLMPPERKEEIRKHFGDTVKATAEFSYVSLGLGMVMGVLLGLIPIPIPGVGIVTLGIGGGPLIVALILGKLRRTGPMLWTMPLPANIVLRNFGLAMFLATVGVNAGQPFVRTVAESGFTMLFIGAAVLLSTVAIVLLVGHYMMRIPYDDLVGVASGATGNPAILVYSTKMAPTERPDIGYAMIFPSMTLVKVIAVQIVGLLTLGSSAGG
ncbi:TrkA C-terminal domain-containing protein [Bradyrhizobium sp. CCGB20]|uniref:aspartate:alanine exchanger family transporter n=1 Tax=Bradyrhizobium sp. CCGB20 TaxID=2949633 RepID=UPI0020B2930F|nr:TrkA C-terminal domain-containing protein [Bradyrhizobium sp. CCGB20]MCP3399724.1 YidE/YbjL duplication [Bradyrhizobium sp. CCGB20]